MRGVIALALVLSTAPIAAAAEEPEDRPARDDEKVQPAITEHAPQAPEMRLAPMVIEERAPVEDSAAQEMPARGSFWWIVGAIVVAGIILAVVL
jgi:hypothetical protein